MSNVLGDMLDQKQTIQLALNFKGYNVTIKSFMLGKDAYVSFMRETKNISGLLFTNLREDITLKGTPVKVDTNLEDNEILLLVKLER